MLKGKGKHDVTCAYNQPMRAEKLNIHNLKSICFSHQSLVLKHIALNLSFKVLTFIKFCMNESVLMSHLFDIFN